MARLRSEPIAPSSVATQSKSTAPAARQALKEKTNTTRAKAPIYEDDGDADGLVKDAPVRRGRPRRVAHQPEEVAMAGGLGAANSEDKNHERTAPPPTTHDFANSDGPPPAARAGRRQPPKKVLRSEVDSQIMEDVKKRMEATGNATAKMRKTHVSQEEEEAPPTSDSLPKLPSAATRPSRSSALERSEFSLSPSPPPPGKLTSVGRHRSSFVQPGSALRAHGTPAVETSILALKNFKRRPRQPSMLQMVQQRTASARPSAVHATEADDSSVFDFDVIEDDFAPEAEGTPFHISKKQAPLSSKTKASGARQLPQPPSAANSRKRKSFDSTSPAVDALMAKRRRSVKGTDGEGRVVDPQDSPSAQRTSPTREKSTSPTREHEAQVINSSPSSTPPTEPSSSAKRQPALEKDVMVPSTEQEQNHEEDFCLPPTAADEDPDDVPVDGTMADPASSPPPFDTQQADIMAYPLTQASPQRSQPDLPVKKQKKPPRLTTAALQSLLPKRRQPVQPRHRKSEYDMDSDSEDDLPHDTSHLDGDEDELGGNVRRQTKSKPSAKKSISKAKAKSRQSKAPAASTRKPTAVPPRKSTATGKQTRTYGKAATASDKENDTFDDLEDDDASGLPDTSMSMYEAAQSKELEAAKKKFARIDEYEMEFESMSFEEHRSSSQGWR